MKARLLHIWVFSVVILALGTTVAEARLPPPSDFSYGMVLNNQGNWRGPKLADGSPDYRIIDTLIRARPTWVRVAPAPYGSDRLMNPQGETARQVWRLRQAGIALGFGVNSGKPMKGSPLDKAGFGYRSAKEVVEHMRAVVEASPGLYDVVLLDFAVLWRERHLQRIVSGARRLGLLPIVNASGLDKDGRPTTIPKGAWAFQKAAQVLRSPNWRKQARQVSRGKRPVLWNSDRKFVRTINRRRKNATPILRFTVPEGVVFRFEKLSRRTQRGVLKRLAQRQRPVGYNMTYPLYVPGMPESYRGGANPYDSRWHGERTLGLQTRLMRSY